MVCGSQQATEHSSTTEAFFLNNKEATVTINMASKQGDDPIKLLQKYFQKYSKQFQQLGFSGIVGVFSGYAFKRISKEIAFTIGGVFILLQVSCILYTSTLLLFLTLSSSVQSLGFKLLWVY